MREQWVNLPVGNGIWPASAHEVSEALAEFKRVLVSDGFLVITCPDLQEVATLVADDKLLEPAYTAHANLSAGVADQGKLKSVLK